jgi:nucleoside-diphosphate-sugar epimerase
VVKALVVGGSGFIGTRLLDVLREQGHEVRNLDLRASERHGDVTTLGDVRDLDAVRAASAGVDVAVNLAAEHRDDVRPLSLYTSVNVDGARTVARALADNRVPRLVFTSTVAVYGLGVPAPDESAPTRPFNEYGRTKLAAEGVLREWALSDPTRSLTVVRPCVVFGEGNRGNVYNLVRQVASGRFVQVGAGHNRKSMAYVGNVAAFLASRTNAPPGVEVVNYADKPDLTAREIVDLVRDTLDLPPSRVPVLPLPLGLAAGHAADLVARATGRTLPVSAVRVRKFTAETTVDSSRLEASGFARPYDLRDALRQTVRGEFGSA